MRSGKDSKSKQPFNSYSNNTIAIKNLSSLPNSNPPNKSTPSSLTTILEQHLSTINEDSYWKESMLAKRRKAKVKMKDSKSQRRATSQALQAHEVCSSGRSRTAKHVQFKRPIVLVKYFAKDDMPNKVNSLQSNLLNMTKISNVKVYQKAPGHVGRMEKSL